MDDVRIEETFWSDDTPQRLRHFKGNEPAPIFVKEWYQNGQLGFEMIFKKPITFVKRWNEEGNLYYEYESKQIEIQGVNRSQNIKDTYYYPNGQIAKHTEGYEETKYFDKDGNRIKKSEYESSSFHIENIKPTN